MDVSSGDSVSGVNSSSINRLSCIIISIGTELIEGLVQDSHLKYLGPRLKDLGIVVKRFVLVPDVEAVVHDELLRAMDASPLVLVTGGLGPTSDDITRDIIARAACVEQEFSETVWQSILKRFGGKKPAETNRKQAFIPAGFRVMENREGTAPGFYGRINGCLIYVLPGPPRELKAMFEEAVLPGICSTFQCNRAFVELPAGAFMMTESALEEGLQRFQGPGIQWRTRLADDRIVFTILGTSIENIRGFFSRVQEHFGSHRIREGDKSIAAYLFEALKEKGKTISFAESCTGGLLGKLITDFPGSSALFSGGHIVYSDKAKCDLLGVPYEIIESHGAVSEEVVKILAGNSLRDLNTDYSVAVSGIAGPGGGSDEKPVGTIWIGLASKKGDLRAKKFIFSGSRDRIRRKTSIAAFILVETMVLGEVRLDIFDEW